MGFPRHHSALVLASFITVASFIAATAYTQNRLVQLDELSSTIETNAAPSVEYLGRGAVALRRLRQLLYEGLKPAGEQAASVKGASSALASLEQDVTNYLQLSPLPGERELWSALRTDLTHAADIARSVLKAEERGDVSTASTLLRSAAEAAFDRADRSMLAALEFDVSQSQRLAREVRDVRRATLKMVVLLDAFASAVAAVAALIAYRASRHHDELLNRHNSLLTARVEELDQFSGRVAHDILNPLSTIGVGLALVARSADSQAKTHIERAQRAARRVQDLVDGLLAFARSGAQPGSGVRCTPDVVLANIAADCSEAARERGIELVIQPTESTAIACSAAVLTSVAQNLVWNAIKYMGNAPIKQVVVRTTIAEERMRLEVEDTGPGINAELQARMFEPFVRGPYDVQGGMGLGLATVKRLVEAHGGTVGVKSRIGSGSLFWIELPLATGSSRPRPGSNSQSLLH